MDKFLMALLLDEAGNLRLDEKGELEPNGAEIWKSVPDGVWIKIKSAPEETLNTVRGLFSALSEAGGKKVEKPNDGKVLITSLKDRNGARS